MRVTFLTRSLNPGGAERQLVALAAGLHRRGHRVLVASFYGGGPLEADLREAGVPCRSLEKGGRWDTFGFLRRLVRLVRGERPQVLHGYLGVPNVLTVLLKPLFPKVRAVWGFRASTLDLGRYDRVSRLALQAERLLSRFADLIVVNSYVGREHAIGYGFPKGRIVVVPNGIDADRFCPDPQARRRVREEWGVADEKLVGLIARLIPIKDHPNFLKAAALLSRERGDVRFVCVGDGRPAYREELRATSEGLGLESALIWAGARDDVPAVFNALDVSVSSSYGEGFPNVVGESMACGTPCVVTDVGDSAAIVGDTGAVVPPRDPEALARGVAAVLDGSLSVDHAALRARIVDNFGVEALLIGTEEALAGGVERG